jgi:hypothetical protein
MAIIFNGTFCQQIIGRRTAPVDGNFFDWIFCFVTASDRSEQQIYKVPNSKFNDVHLSIYIVCASGK